MWTSWAPAFPLNGWAVRYGATEHSPIIRLERLRSLLWFRSTRLLGCPKRCRWSRGRAWAFPALLRIARSTLVVMSADGRFSSRVPLVLLDFARLLWRDTRVRA